jgi:hypothetical protein
MVSSVLPQRMSLATSRTGASPWWMPTERMLAPMAVAISCTSSGSNDAPQASGVGNTVAVQAAKPVRHSSCATAGMPNRLAPATWACSSRRVLRATTGGSGRVPNTRVTWPRPSRMSSARGSGAAFISPCMGATLASRGWSPIQMLVSWATFSASVIRPSRSSTRSAAGRAGSRQISAVIVPGPTGKRVTGPSRGRARWIPA